MIVTLRVSILMCTEKPHRSLNSLIANMLQQLRDQHLTLLLHQTHFPGVNVVFYCCGQRRCVTTFARFSKLCLDPDVLEIEQQHSDDNSTRAFRKAAYRQFILDRYGHLGKGNRKVCPSCVVKTVRRHYPSQTGVYMGYRPE